MEKLGQEQKEKGAGAIDISQIIKRLTTDTSLLSVQILLILAQFTNSNSTAAELVWGDSQGFLDAGFDKYGLIEEKDVCIHPFLPSETSPTSPV